MTIKDKYSLVGIRRLPWNYKGVMTIESDIDHTSAPSYVDSLGRFLLTDQDVGGKWGKGVKGKIPVGNLWFWNAGNGVKDSLGTFGEKVLLYFNGTDTLSRLWGDSLDAWIQRDWIVGAHAMGNTGYSGGGPGLDSSHVFKALNYMQNHGLEKIYKSGVWVGHDGNYINTEQYGANPATIYYHVNKSFASGKFKFDWDGALQEIYFLSYYDIRSNSDSLNVVQVIFSPTTFPDGITRFYRYKRNGNWNSAVPEQTYNWFNKSIANSVINNWQVYIYYTHFGKNNGLTSASIDSIRAVHQIKDSLGLWIPNTKEILNQQAASAFAQVRVEYLNGKRTLNITSLKDWSWGSHTPDPVELNYLTFDCFDAESLDIVINGTTKLDVQKGKDFTEVKPDWTGYGNIKAPMYWFAKKDRKFDKLMVIPGKAIPINYPPVLDSIRAKTVNEGQILTFRLQVTDANNDSIVLSAANLPVNAIFIDSGNGAGSFRFSPSYTQAGVYNVTFTARDTLGATDSEVVSITVVNVNNPPVLDSIGAKTVDEAQTLSFRIHATDINGDRLILSALDVPTNATFTDSTNGTGLFTFSPSYTQSGVYNVTFIARDTVGAADSEVVQITVINVNNPPVLDSIGPKVVDEGQVLNFRVHATDLNGDSMILSALNIPANAIFTDSSNGSGLFTFTPSFNQAGIYDLTFIARDTAGAADSELVAITVNNVNNPPVLDSIGPKSVNEGQALSFRVHSSDVNGDSLILDILNLPTNAAFTDSGNGSGSFAFNPDYIQAGVYTLTFIARDTAGAADSEIVAITVNNVNNPPVLDSIGPKSVNEGQALSFRVHSSDVNGDSLILDILNLPTNAAFTDSGNGSGSFIFSPDYAQAGVYNVTFIARDTVEAEDSEVVAITVVNLNNPPVLDSIGSKSVNEGQVLTFRVHATDINGDSLILSALNVPANATFTDSTNGSGSFRFTPDFTQSGIYNVTFIARDTVGAEDSEVVAIIIDNVNNPPVLDSIGPKSVTEGQVLTFRVHATDINGDRLILSALDVPANATFTDSTNGAGSFTFSPSYAQAGIYNVTFITRDTVGAADSEVVAITVISAGNQTPVLDSIGSRSVNEGSNLTFRVYATDLDQDSIVLSATDLPLDAIFTDSGNGAGSFRFNPSYVQAGIYNITFKATDPSLATDSEVVQITVNNINNPPVLDSIGPKSMDEGQVLTFRIHSTDINGDSLILNALNTPSNAIFTDSGNGAGSFTFSPSYTQAGVYNVTFIARDTIGAADSELVNITVNNLNHEPVLDSIGAKTMDEGTILVFRVYATDADAESLILTASNLPFNAIFTDSGNGSGLFNFSPNCTQAGIYNVTFKATDPFLATDSEVVQITVNLNHAPALSLPADTSYKSCTLGDSILLKISASDPDIGDSLTLSKLSTDGELRPSDPIRGIDSLSGNFFWRPVYADTLFNPHLIIFRVTDKCGHIVTDTVQIRIQFNHLPVLTSQDSSYSLCQDSTVCFDHLIGSDSDPDDSLRLELVSGPRCLFLTTMINPTLLTGFVCFITSGTDSVYTFIFELKDRCGAVDRDTVRIQVRPPANLTAGDPNGDLFVTVSDVVYIINYLFKSGPPPVHCPRSGDVNCDGKVTVTDAVYLINYLFKGGSEPCR